MAGAITTALSSYGAARASIQGSPKEDEVTRALYGAMWPDLIGEVLRALLAGAPRDRVEEILAQPFYLVYIPTSAPCPDIVVTDADGAVLCVIEHKIRAPSNGTTVKRAAHHGYLHTAAAAMLGVEGMDVEPHSWDECTCGDDHLVKGPKHRHALAIWQIDTYSFTTGWLRRNGWTIKDPATVLWVLLDLRGRAAADVFTVPGQPPNSPLTARSADQWHTTSYTALVPALLQALPLLPRQEREDRAHETASFHHLLTLLSAVTTANGLPHLA
jgi:hypothetical protein